MDLESMDIAEERKAELKALFPSVFTETVDENGNLVESIDFEKLKAELGTFSDVFESRRERYGMNWPGKKDCMKIIQQPSRATLKPSREESVNFDDTENLFIEGDNLEVLKLLQKAYYGKVKMIYIDPPYNTGKEFIYPDNYSESLETYLNYAGLADEEGRKFSTNTANEGRFHTKWLNMMYPRLYLARNLLREDGVIFISIDDNEVTNLRKLCDDVFGEENWISQFVAQLNPRGRHLDRFAAKTHEYVLAYAKDAEAGGTIGSLTKTGKMLDEYREKDENGRFRRIELRNRNPAFNSRTRKNLYFPIFVDPQDGTVALERTDTYNVQVWPKNSAGGDSCWTWGPEKVSAKIDVLTGRQVADGGWRIYRKDYLLKNGEVSKTLPKSLWIEKEFNNDHGKKAIQDLLGSTVMDFPKSPDYIRRMVQLGAESEDIVLDFFSGSCTTAHAILNLNQQDGGDRKFIMVQLPEPCDDNSEAARAGYKTIADIGKERIRRVIKKIESEQTSSDAQGDLLADADEPKDLDLGFKVLKLDRSNFTIWDGSDTEISEEELAEQLELHVDHIDPDAGQEDLLYELLLKAGFMPTEKVTKLEMAGKTVFSVAEGMLLICLENEITRELIDAVAEAEPGRFICLDKGFQDNDQLKANAMQTFAALNEGRDEAQQIVFRTV